MRLHDYLSPPPGDARSAAWAAKLHRQVAAGRALYAGAAPERRALYDRMFADTVATERLKAWYGAPERGSLFQGTSVTSLTIPYEVPEPLAFDSPASLEAQLVEAYVALHDRHEPTVRRTILEPVDKWMSEGLYYGVLIGSKIISQCFGLSAHRDEVVFPVDGMLVDPHEITSYPQAVRQAYFEECRRRIGCLDGLDITRTEFENSLVLADISKPKIESYRDRLLLGPFRCNEIAANLSRRVGRGIAERTGGRIKPRSLMVGIYDTDTPYTYHQVAGWLGQPMAPVLPGLTLMGCSGSIDAFRWLYLYRTSLLAQKIMKGSLYSEVERRFIPFVFFGVLVERDAEILLDMDGLSDFRYPGNISPFVEYSYLVNGFDRQLEETVPFDPDAELARLDPATGAR